MLLLLKWLPLSLLSTIYVFCDSEFEYSECVMSQGNAGTSHLALSLAKTNNWSPLCVLDGCGVWFYFSSDFRPGQCHGTHIKYNRMRT